MHMLSALPAAQGAAVHSFSPYKKTQVVTIEGRKDSVKRKGKLHVVGNGCLIKKYIIIKGLISFFYRN
jgi:hypothetical protein